jgi:hypothetical protein
MEEKECEDSRARARGVEEYHRGVKQSCGVERSQLRRPSRGLPTHPCL